MKGLEILYLSQRDVQQAGLDMAEIIPIVEEAFRQHGQKAVEMPARVGLYPRPGSFVQTLMAHVGHLDAAGAKLVSVYPGNLAKGLVTTAALLVLTDPATGLPLAVMDATWITAMRTGAATAVAVKYLVSPDAEGVAIIGAGAQGRGNLLALVEVLPDLKEVRVHDIRRDAALRYAEEMTAATGRTIQVAATAQEAVEGADLIVTATAMFRERTVLVRRDWVRPGALVAPLEVDRAIDPRLLAEADLFVVDDWEQTKAFQVMGCFPEGLPTATAELGEIVAGRKPGRSRADQLIVAMNVGLAIEDVTVGRQVYERALAQGIGRRLPLYEGL